MDTRKPNKRTTKRRRRISGQTRYEKECQETNVQNSQDPDEENIVLPEFKRERIVPIFPPRAKEARRLPPPIPMFDIKPKGSKVQHQEVAEKEAPSSNQPGGLQKLLEAYGSEDESEEEKAQNENSVSALKALQVYEAPNSNQTGGLQQLLEAFGSEDESEEEKALNENSVSTLKALQVYYASDDSQD